MLPLPIPRIFNKAGAAGHVFVLNGGKTINRGLAYSGIVSPFSTIAVVPTTPQVVDFETAAVTNDNQSITVSGNINVLLDPAVSRSKFDFSVDVGRGSYVNDWRPAADATIREQANTAVLDKATTIDVFAAVKDNKGFEAAIAEAVQKSEILKSYGISFVSVSVATIEPGDEEVQASVGVNEREAIIQAADKARHRRQMAAAVNTRAVKKYDAQTLQKMEKERKTLLVLQGENKQKEAADDAAATQTRLAPLVAVESGKLFSASIMEAARSGRLTNLTITSEFLARVGK